MTKTITIFTQNVRNDLQNLKENYNKNIRNLKEKYNDSPYIYNSSSYSSSSSHKENVCVNENQAELGAKKALGVDLQKMFKIRQSSRQTNISPPKPPDSFQIMRQHAFLYLYNCYAFYVIGVAKHIKWLYIFYLCAQFY